MPIPHATPDSPSAPLESGELFRRYAPTVARWAARLAGPGLDLEDLVQEVFLSAHRQLAGFRGDAAITTWLFAITRNVVRGRLRRLRVREIFSRLLGESTDEGMAAPPSRPTPLEALERRESNALIYRALAGLSERYRTVFVLFEIEGLSGEEVSQLTGVRVDTLFMQRSRARAQMAERITKLEGQLEGRSGRGDHGRR